MLTYIPKWWEVGEALNMAPETLNISEAAHPKSCEERCKLMLRKWLQLDKMATCMGKTDSCY